MLLTITTAQKPMLRLNYRVPAVQSALCQLRLARSGHLETGMK